MIERGAESGEQQARGLNMTSMTHVITRYFDRLRPTSFDQLIGQRQLTSRLERLMRRARRGEHPFPPLLLVGERGVGKRGIASAMAHELADGDEIYEMTPGDPPDLEAARAMLEELEDDEVVVVEQLHDVDDEIRRKVVEAAQISVEEGEAGDEERYISSFTLVGMTEPAESDTFSPVWNPVRVRDYNTEELIEIADWSADRLGIELTEEAAFRLARHSRGHARWLKVTLVRLVVERADMMDERRDWVVEAWMVDEVVD